jgi:hypothetical protein
MHYLSVREIQKELVGSGVSLFSFERSSDRSFKIDFKDEIGSITDGPVAQFG